MCTTRDKPHGAYGATSLREYFSSIHLFTAVPCIKNGFVTYSCNMRTISIVFIIFLGIPLISCSNSGNPEKDILIRQFEKVLKENELDAWYPVTIDTVHGGFLSDFTYDWQPSCAQDKMVVTQTRHVWTASQAALFYDDEKYRHIASHGFDYLRGTMRDETYGGFYTLRDRSGQAIPGPESDYKTAYGNAFGIYSLAAYYELTGDTAALNLAKNTFIWLDEHSRDPHYRGYVDRLNRDGSWLHDRYVKDYNSSIHLLEAFTELYRVWPDNLVRERLLEMLTLIRDTLTHEKGYLLLFFERDWTPVSYRDSSAAIRETNYYFDHVSFGHDVETAYLMLEAMHALGIEDDRHTVSIAKKMVDHALDYGWDRENGGFYYQGYYFDELDTLTVINDVKTWWVQAEGLNALLLMSQLFPEDGRYYDAFLELWNYINAHLIDHAYGGWYVEGLDNSPEARSAPKATIWKVNYHTVRALMNCIIMLRSGIGMQ
jgi:cellobiose epimerase